MHQVDACCHPLLAPASACPQFPHTPYLGHHKELGLNGIYLLSTQDCWVKDVAIVNSDNGVLIEEVSKCKCWGTLKLVYSSRRACAVGSLHNRRGLAAAGVIRADDAHLPAGATSSALSALPRRATALRLPT